MKEAAANRYQPQDQLYLWWLANSEKPVFIGAIKLSRAPRGVSLSYSDEWCEHGLALSEDLPLLQGQEFFPREDDTAAGAVDNGIPVLCRGRPFWCTRCFNVSPSIRTASIGSVAFVEGHQRDA